MIGIDIIDIVIDKCQALIGIQIVPNMPKPAGVVFNSLTLINHELLNNIKFI